jgi:hypothetical protein
MKKLLVLAGSCYAGLGLITINENVLLGIIVLLSGLLTVLVGCLTAAFLSHIADHKKNK